MSKESNTQTNRRRLLKTLAVGGGVVVAGKTLPEHWTRPAVDAVALPAHAQTSFTGNGSFTGAQTVAEAGNILDGLVATAMASYPTDAQFCINVVDGMASIQVLFGTSGVSAAFYTGAPVTVPFANVTLTYRDELSCASVGYPVVISGQLTSSNGVHKIEGTITLESSNPLISVDYSLDLVPGPCDLTPGDC